MSDSPSGLQALAGKRVLICEDEGITIMQLSRAVAHAGLVVAGIAPTGPKALEFALRERPDIILLDIRIPEMDGLELVRRIVREYSACVITLVAQAGEVAEAESAGSSASVIKPADSEELLRVLPACAQRFSHAVVREPDPITPLTRPRPVEQTSTTRS